MNFEEISDVFKVADACNNYAARLARQYKFYIFDADGKKILQAKGDIASPIIKERLENLCNFTQITVYQTIAINNHDPKIISLINSNKAKGFVFSSPSEFRSFLNIEKIANFATDTAIFCIGKTTAEFIKNQGFTNVHTSPEPNFEILAEHIANTFKTL